MYVSTQTRANISFAVSYLSCFCKNPTQRHYKQGKCLLHYLAHTPAVLIEYQFGETTNQKELRLWAYSNSDWARDHDTRKSTSGYIILAGRGPIAWAATQQKLVALFTCEAECYSLTDAVKQILYIQHLLTKLGYNGSDLKLLTLLCNNQAAEALIKDLELYRRAKQIDIKFHFIHQHQQCGDIDT